MSANVANSDHVTLSPDASDALSLNKGQNTWAKATENDLQKLSRGSFVQSFNAGNRKKAERLQRVGHNVTLFTICVLYIVALSLESVVARGGVCLLIMGIIWVSEIVKLELAGLIPIFLYSSTGIVKAKAIAGKFWNGTSFLFCVGFLMGIVLERWNLHKRFAVTLVLKAGKRIDLLLFLMMFSVYLLSMWISNTATILCMLPVVHSFLATVDDKHKDFKGAMLLAVGWSATIGGLSTPVGTPTNTLFLGIYETKWGSEFQFAPFMAFALPLSFMLFLTAWALVCAWHVWGKRVKVDVDLQVFRDERKKLGPMKFEEYIITFYFLILIIVWIVQKPIKKAFNLGMMDTGSMGMLFTFPLFFIPTRSKKLERTKDGIMKPAKHILDWSYAVKMFKWQILFIFGGGYMVAFGTEKSGFAKWLAELIGQMDEFALATLVVFVICFLTEVISNMSCVQIFGPLLVAVAGENCYSPLKFLLVVCFASSFAFMMPMAGGPNMMVFGTGENFSLKFMVKHGFVLNVLSCIIGILYLSFIMPPILIAQEHGLPFEFQGNSSKCP